MIGAFIVTMGVVFYENKYYYPPVPMETVSKKEVLATLKNTSDNIVKIAVEKDYDWFITRMEEGKAYENLKKLISKSGWKYLKQEGSNYFFEKVDKTLIASTEMWTGNYVIVKLPSDWNE